MNVLLSSVISFGLLTLRVHTHQRLVLTLLQGRPSCSAAWNGPTTKLHKRLETKGLRSACLSSSS